MKYGEMVEFLSDNNIRVIQPVIAYEVGAQLYGGITDEEFEIVCERIYRYYLDGLESNIQELVSEVLYSMGYK